MNSYYDYIQVFKGKRDIMGELDNAKKNQMDLLEIKA